MKKLTLKDDGSKVDVLLDKARTRRVESNEDACFHDAMQAEIFNLGHNLYLTPSGKDVSGFYAKCPLVGNTFAR